MRTVSIPSIVASILLGLLPIVAPAAATAATVPSTTLAAQEPPEETAVAEPVEVAVVATVQRLFDAMAERDRAAAEAVLLLEGQLFRVVPGNGDGSVSRTAHREFLKSLETGSGRWLERMWDPVVRVRGPVAMVWTPYDFHRDGELSHCGVDLFQLVRTPEGWKIAGGTYTVETSGCDSPLGPPE